MSEVNVLIETIKHLSLELKEKEDRILSMTRDIQKVHEYLNSAGQCINDIDDVFEYWYRFVSKEKLRDRVVTAMSNHSHRCRQIIEK